MQELIITKYNINEFIEKEYITFKSNILKLLVKVNKLNNTYNNIIILNCINNELTELKIDNFQLEYLYYYNNKLTKLEIDNLF